MSVTSQTKHSSQLIMSWCQVRGSLYGIWSVLTCNHRLAVTSCRPVNVPGIMLWTYGNTDAAKKFCSGVLNVNTFLILANPYYNWFTIFHHFLYIIFGLTSSFECTHVHQCQRNHLFAFLRFPRLTFMYSQVIHQNNVRSHSLNRWMS